MSENTGGQFHILMGVNDSCSISNVVSFQKRTDLVNVDPDMFHVILFETGKTDDDPPRVTTNIVCKLLDAKYYATQLSETLRNVVGFVFNKHDHSLEQAEGIIDKMNNITSDIWGKANDRKAVH